MKITLISEEEYNCLINIQKNNPILTFQNEGYEYIDKSKFDDNDKVAFNTVTEILKKHIVEFNRFDNFKLDREGKIKLRFHYNYNYESINPTFIGVGYLHLTELLNGFNK